MHQITCWSSKSVQRICCLPFWDRRPTFFPEESLVWVTLARPDTPVVMVAARFCSAQLLIYVLNWFIHISVVFFCYSSETIMHKTLRALLLTNTWNGNTILQCIGFRSCFLGGWCTRMVRLVLVEDKDITWLNQNDKWKQLTSCTIHNKHMHQTVSQTHTSINRLRGCTASTNHCWHCSSLQQNRLLHMYHSWVTFTNFLCFLMRI